MSTSMHSESAIVQHSGISPSCTTLPPVEHRSDARLGLVARHRPGRSGSGWAEPGVPRSSADIGWKNRTTIETRELDTGLQTALASRIVIQTGQERIRITNQEAHPQLSMRPLTSSATMSRRRNLQFGRRRLRRSSLISAWAVLAAQSDPHPIPGHRSVWYRRSTVSASAPGSALRSPRNRRRRRSPGSRPLAPSTARDVQRSSGSSTSAAQLDPNADG